MLNLVSNLVFILNVQPGLNGAHFFARGNAPAKIAGVEDGIAAQKIKRRIASNGDPDVSTSYCSIRGL